MLDSGRRRFNISSDLNKAFREVVAMFPGNPAVTDANSALSYAALNGEVQKAAEILARAGVTPGALVAIKLHPSVELIVVLLAVLRRGACYLPLDPGGPPQRNGLILADAQPVAVIEQPSGTTKNRTVPITPTAVLRLRDESDEAPGDAPVIDHGGRTAYVIFTSGTTGRPKGVPVTHRNVLSLFAGTDRLFEFSEDDRWLLHHSVAFDFSVWEIWGALLHGGHLLVPDRWLIRDATDTARFIQDHGITVLNQTPTAFDVLAPELIELRDQLRLRYVIFGGERLRPASLASWVDSFGLDAPVLVNMYGITEVTVHASYHRISPQDLAGNASPIGHPLPGFEVRILGEGGAVADRGELLLAGPQVVTGYLHRPELTRTKFVDPDGQGTVYYRSGDIVEHLGGGRLAYLGRADQQVKIRGHRVELGEVEAAVAAVPGVAAVCVLPVTHGGAPALGCVYTTIDGESLPETAIRRTLRARLPDYMVPSKIFRVDSLPVNQNGKTDRDVLQKAIDRGEL